jgi:DNA-directed RNA polymerase specialized sigma24 family protein
VRGKVQSEEDAEDIMQDVWYQLSNLTNIDDLESASGWLFQVARTK